MRGRPIVASVLCAGLLGIPATALALTQQGGGDAKQTQEVKAAVSVEPTDELASNYSSEAGDYVFESIRLSGNAGPFVQTFNVPEGYPGNDVMFYIEHSDGNTELLKRTIPDTDNPTVDIDVTVNGETIVTAVLELWDKDAQSTYDGPRPTHNPISVQNAYEEFAQRLGIVLIEAQGAEAKAQLVTEDSSQIEGTPIFAAIPTLPGSSSPSRYPENYRGPKNNGVCLGTFSYSFNIPADSLESSEEPSIGFKFSVDQKYAGMTAKVYIDSGNLHLDTGTLGETATHVVKVSEDGVVTVPYGMFQPTFSDTETEENGGKYFRDFYIYDTSRSGLISINVEPSNMIGDAEVNFYDYPQELVNENGMRVSIHNTELPLNVTQFYCYAGSYSDGTGRPSYELPGPGGLYAGRVNLSFVPYGTIGNSGYVTLKIELGEQYAGRKATVYSGIDWAPDVITEIRTHTIDSEGAIYLTRRCVVQKQDSQSLDINLSGTAIIALVNIEPEITSSSTDIAKAATIAPIPDQKWSGSPVTPKPTVTAGEKTLVEGVDYTLSYENNVNAGVATVVVTGTGSYTGELRASFKIVKDTGSTTPDGADNPNEPSNPSDEPCDGGTNCPTHSFPDVIHDAWYHGPVDWAVSNGVITGYANGEFGPDDPLGRAQMATILWRVAGKPATNVTELPADCDPSSFYAEPLAWALAEGIFHGNADGTFAPDAALTREQAAVVLYNRAGQPEGRASLEGFRDANSISPFATDAVSWAVSEGILSGTANGSLEPTRACSRAELAALLMRMDEADMLQMG